ncbi:MAG: 50S ribosomal protein L7/L12 [Armatimonadetes bacterium]|nr:50S ribosomal protein L7/L12 [Armatimonadota bacterium]
MAKTLDKDEIMDALSQMSVLDLVELTKMIEEKWGVTAAAPMMAMAAAPAAAAEPQEEKTSFDLVLAEVGPNKIQVIKVVREVTSLGLKEAKEIEEPWQPV